MVNQIHVSDEQIHTICSFKRKFRIKNEKIKEITKNIIENWKELNAEISDVDNYVDQIRNILSPKQFAKYIITLDKVHFLLN